MNLQSRRHKPFLKKRIVANQWPTARDSCSTGPMTGYANETSVGELADSKRSAIETHPMNRIPFVDLLTRQSYRLDLRGFIAERFTTRLHTGS